MSNLHPTVEYHRLLKPLAPNHGGRLQADAVAAALDRAREAVRRCEVTRGAGLEGLATHRELLAGWTAERDLKLGGSVRDAAGVAVSDPDASARDRIRLVFARSLTPGRVSKVPRSLVDDGLDLPGSQTSGLYAGAVLWKRPSSHTLYSLLKHPGVHRRELPLPRVQAGHPGEGG